MAAKSAKKMSDAQVKKFQKELKQFIDKKLGKRPYQCIVSYVVNEEVKKQKKGGNNKTITANLTMAGNLKPDMPFMTVNAIFQNLGNGLKRLISSFYGKLKQDKNQPPAPPPAEQLKAGGSGEMYR